MNYNYSASYNFYMNNSGSYQFSLPVSESTNFSNSSQLLQMSVQVPETAGTQKSYIFTKNTGTTVWQCQRFSDGQFEPERIFGNLPHASALESGTNSPLHSPPKSFRILSEQNKSGTATHDLKSSPNFTQIQHRSANTEYPSFSRTSSLSSSTSTLSSPSLSPAPGSPCWDETSC